MGTAKTPRGRPPLSIVAIVIFIFFMISLLYTERFSSSIFKFKSCSRRASVAKSTKSTRDDGTTEDDLVNTEVDDRFEFDPNECSVAHGKWVFNSSFKPLYSDRTCPYLDRQFSCVKNGRPDSDYRQWEWQPDDCILPRFSPTIALEKLRGKRLMFVGDSLQRNQWESFVCLVEFVIPDDRKSMRRGRSHSVFTVKEYNATVEFYWAPFLVESNSDNPIIGDPKKRILKVDSVSKHAKYWVGVDILAFNTYVWWMSGTKVKSLSEDWNHKDGIKCFNETKPVSKKGHWGTGSNKQMMSVVAGVVEKMRVPVIFINITQLSEYRKDGHSSVYNELGGKLLTDEQRADPKHYADCIHWCLPGVPDTWNQIFLAHL
ncbi:protein trichome birefringence-like 3 isoform X2 [Actinidia eriantha]|uniref:protein trichome birefringence-like 3 isoform X2 n=1 Tax=Actinidia eriantha TaxID=165200 RepID=UPI0025868924|nr:protein trichome birefringence-like 3 isoform X2 [Actinidia eriantha]